MSLACYQVVEKGESGSTNNNTCKGRQVCAQVEARWAGMQTAAGAAP